MSNTKHYRLLPFRFASDEDDVLLVNDIGMYYNMPKDDFNKFTNNKLLITSKHYNNLKSNYMLYDNNLSNVIDLLANAYRTKKRFLYNFTNLHMIVITKRCNQKCTYCHASSIDDALGKENDIDISTLHKCIDIILQSQSDYLKIEIQGGEPLLRFDLIKETIEYSKSKTGNKHLEYVICTNLLNIDQNMLEYIKENNVQISTSLDGPKYIHDSCRKLRNGNGSYDHYINSLALCKSYLPNEYISALVTINPFNIFNIKDVIDEYLKHGFNSIFIRSLNPFGRARELITDNEYNGESFFECYKQAVEYIININKKGVYFTEYFTSLLLTRILTPFSTGFVDLQSPAGTGICGVIYDIDGSIYVSDEARMLNYETGDKYFCLGNADNSWKDIFGHQKLRDLIKETCIEAQPGCAWCVYQPYCGIDPVRNYRLYGSCAPNVNKTDHCFMMKNIFKYLFNLIETSDSKTLDILWSWITGRTDEISV